MKNSLLRVFGRTVFWAGWPVLYFYLRETTRTRVVITVGDMILVTKGWLGDGRWELPGGGVHKGENIAAGAVREVKEETGIVLEKQALKHSDGFITSNHKISFRCEPFFVRLGKQPPLILQNSEIAELKWVRYQDLDEINTETASLAIIMGFKQQSLL